MRFTGAAFSQVCSGIMKALLEFIGVFKLIGSVQAEGLPKPFFSAAFNGHMGLMKATGGHLCWSCTLS